MIKHASKRNLVDKGAIVALKDKNLAHNFSTIWYKTKKVRSNGL